MTSETDAVAQAAQLLVGRLSEARTALGGLDKARDDLTKEITRIEAALSALAVGPTDSEAQLVTDAADGALFSQPIGGMSVRAAVKHILDAMPRALTSKEIRDLIPEEIMAGKPSDYHRVNSVSTALWSLRKAGEAVQVEGKKTISSKWAVSTSEIPHFSSQIDNQEGGVGDHATDDSF
jgi:hypothetical protein